MNRSTIKFVAAMLICISCGATAVLVADQPPSTARATMEQVTKEVLAVLRDPNLSADEKRDKVKEIAYANLNFEVMARLSLGRYWRGLTDDQRTQYLQEFKEHLTNTYGHTTDNYAGEDVQVISDRAEQDGDVTVQTRITGTKDNKPNEEIAKVDYRLRKQDDQWKVIDFTIDGVSLVANFRSQFEEIMSEGGIDELLKRLHDKNAATQN
jgi:phospholipid transport system substrate-binding protein